MSRACLARWAHSFRNVRDTHATLFDDHFPRIDRWRVCTSFECDFLIFSFDLIIWLLIILYKICIKIYNIKIVKFLYYIKYSIYPIYSLAESLWRKEGSFEKISIYKSRIVNNEIRIFGRKIIISFNRREKENNFNFIERMYISSLIYIYDAVEPERERKRVFSTIAYRNEIQILATFRNAASCFLGTASSY